MSTAAPARCRVQPRYSDSAAEQWVRQFAPLSWLERIELDFRHLPLGSLQSAGSWTDAARIAWWAETMQSGRCVPALVACRTEHDRFYLFDGNHRYHALRQLFGDAADVPVRLAVAQPRPGYEFRYRWFDTYGTYLVEPSSVPGRAIDNPDTCFAGRTLVLAAHPDDETGGCSGLLQRLPDAVVVFATEGAPLDKFFWGPHTSQRNYALLRRHEAAKALAAAGVWRQEFLPDYADGLVDRQLHRALPQAFTALAEVIRCYEPTQVLVPAYEGGHPDHDACSFLGHLVQRRLGLPVWEMPLYHRADCGLLVPRRFQKRNGSERMLHLSPRELEVRRAMVESYASQSDLGLFVASQVEFYRPQPAYNYARPPHPGKLNYEVWEWPVSPLDLCGRFLACPAVLDQAPEQDEPPLRSHSVLPCPA